MQDRINNNAYIAFNSNRGDYAYMYYTNSQAKTILEKWYQINIGSKSDLAKNVASGDYYCEQAKVKYVDGWTPGNANMTLYSSYTPEFKCATDGNGKGVVNASVGLLTYDEVVYAGGYYNQRNSNYYLYNSEISRWWTMSPVGFSASYSRVWVVLNYLTGDVVTASNYLRPVLNLNADTQISDGDGTKDSPFIVE